MTQARDEVGDLHPRQLPPFTWFCTLGNFDLQLLALVEVLRRHAKAARGDLLDLGRRIVTIRFRMEMCGIFSAFTAVRLCPDAVHRNVQRFVCLRTKRPKRHAGRHKTFANRCDAFHLIQWHWRSKRFNCQQITQMDRRICLHPCRILFPQVIACPITGRLHHMHRLCFPSVGFPRFPGFVKSPHWKKVRLTRPSIVMNFHGFFLHPAHTNARNATDKTREIFRAHCAG